MFNKLINCPATISCIDNDLSNYTASSHIMFGPSGTGKTTASNLLFERFISDGWGREETLFRYINSAQNNGVDFIRELEKTLKDRFIFRNHFYIFDEAHRMSRAAWDSLLLTLEAMPDNTVFCFCTTEIKTIPSTITSRCYMHQFSTLSVESLVALAERDNLAPDLPKAVIEYYAAASNGNVREFKKQLGSYDPDSELSLVARKDLLTELLNSKEPAKSSALMNVVEQEFLNPGEFLLYAMKFINSIGIVDLQLEQLTKDVISCVIETKQLSDELAWEIIRFHFVWGWVV